MIYKSAPISSFIEDLLSQMTTEEKVAMLAGTNMWYTVPVERLGISIYTDYCISSNQCLKCHYRSCR
jgi:hypothetical protein